MTDFGYSTIGASSDNPGQQWVWCKATGTPSGDGTLTAIQAYCAIRSGAPLVCMALYSDSGGLPDTKIVSNETGALAGAGFGWVSNSFSQHITAGVQYWFGIRVHDSGTDVDVKFDTNGSLTEVYYKASAYAVFPAGGPIGGLTSLANERWSIYGTYTLDSPGVATYPTGFAEPKRRLLNPTLRM